MTETKTKDQTTVAQPAPEGNLPATTSKREAWEDFKGELNKRADEIGSQLPSNVTRDRFLNASIAAVKATPAILTATPRSLFSALTKAAQDGLLPDGREGIITVYNTTVEGRKEIVAQWNPMLYGIRKRARELDGIIIDAQVVLAGDEFDYELGDNPYIKHRPKARAEVVEASAGVAVYAIFRHPEQGILHREVMWKPEVFATMNQSRAKGSLMWTVFWTEGWRKTVARRGSKSVPVSPQLERLIQRDDENFDFARDNASPRLSAPATLPDIPSGEISTPSVEAEKVAEPIGPAAVDGFLQRLKDDLANVDTDDEVLETFNQASPQTALAGRDADIQRAFDLRNLRLGELRMKPAAQSVVEESDFPGDRKFT